MTFITIFPGHGSISQNSVGVTFIAGEAVLKNGFMIKSRSGGRNQVFFEVTMGTISYLGIVLALFKMADKTSAFSDGDVLSLDDLRMTAGTAEFFASFKVGEMDFVIEMNCFKVYRPLKQSFVVATFPQTAFIRDFSPGF
jgi:hypothetical protein